MIKLCLVLPCYNEEAVLASTAKILKEKMGNLKDSGRISPSSRVVFVNDGSKDRTWELIKELHTEDGLFCGVSLSRNRGHQNALLAGLFWAKDKFDAVITIDADLQDDVDAIDLMIGKYEEGCDVVYGVRSSRKTDTFFKRSTALAFYRVMSMMGAETVENHADFRLMSSRAIAALEQFKEVNLFLRGLVPLIGFKSDSVYYERKERTAGETKYPLKKMLSFAFEGITSFSVKPIRFITGLGVFIFFVSIVMLIYSLIRYFTGHTVEGWTFLSVSIWGLSGIQLLALGVIGEYVGKIYIETKGRPRFIIEEVLE